MRSARTSRAAAKEDSRPLWLSNGARVLYDNPVGSKASTDTRRLILETATGLLRRYGPDKLTVVDIARELEMSHANVYRFYKTKSEILDAISDEWLTQLESFVEEIVAEYKRRFSQEAVFRMRLHVDVRL